MQKQNKNGCLEGDKYVVNSFRHEVTLQTPDKYKEFNNVNKLETILMMPKYMKTVVAKNI